MQISPKRGYEGLYIQLVFKKKKVSICLLLFCFCFDLLYDWVYTWTDELFLYAVSERKTGGFLLSAHSICVFYNTGFDTFYFISIIIDSLYALQCECVLQYGYSIKECRGLFVFVAVGFYHVYLFVTVTVNLSCSAILCGLHFFFPDNSQNSLCTVIPPLLFLLYFNTGDFKDEL